MELRESDGLAGEFITAAAANGGLLPRSIHTGGPVSVTATPARWSAAR